MSALIIGATKTRTNVEYGWDPVNGVYSLETWEGTFYSMSDMYVTWRNWGFQAKLTQEGPHWKCVIRLGWDSNASTEVAQETWKYSTEEIQIPIWNAPIVQQMWQRLGTTKAVRDATINQIGKSIDDRTVIPEDDDVFYDPIIEEVYRLLKEGVQGFEYKRPTLTRTRTYSIRYAPRKVIDPVEKIYTTDALIAHWSIPAGEVAQLPVNPAALPHATWGWKLRGEETQYVPATGRIAETVEFVFAPWSTLLYQIILT